MIELEPGAASRGVSDLLADDTGASTAEYAIVTMAAVGSFRHT